ncbi:hypothetical protein JCM11251_007669 [Rhodosporidiobolus azoricus]
MSCDSLFTLDPFNRESNDHLTLQPSSPSSPSFYHRPGKSTAEPLSFPSSSSSSSSSHSIALRASLSLTRHLRTRLYHAQGALEAATAEAQFQREQAEEARRERRIVELRSEEQCRALKEEMERERKARKELEENIGEKEGQWEEEQRKLEELLAEGREEKVKEERRADKAEQAAKDLTDELLKLREQNTKLALQLAAVKPDSPSPFTSKTVAPVRGPKNLHTPSSPVLRTSSPPPLPAIRGPRMPASLMSVTHLDLSLPFDHPDSPLLPVPGFATSTELVNGSWFSPGLCRTCGKKGEACKRDPKCVKRRERIERARDRSAS